jgi:glutamate 5-kinase
VRNFGETKRVVVKVGTSSLLDANGFLDVAKIEILVRALADLKMANKQPILVTSGAIGAGLSSIKLDKKTMTAIQKQAVATVGQCQLIGVYTKLFRKHGLIPGQVLITKDMVVGVGRGELTREVFEAMLGLDITPIVNENDAMLVEEIMFGNNDTLSAYVATIVRADLLVMLTDVDGLYDRDPREEGAKLVPFVDEITQTIKDSVGGPSHNFGTGGMITKLYAVEEAAKTGAKTVIANGENPTILHDILAGKEVGTYFDLRK